MMIINLKRKTVIVTMGNQRNRKLQLMRMGSLQLLRRSMVTVKITSSQKLKRLKKKLKYCQRLKRKLKSSKRKSSLNRLKLNMRR